MAAAQTLLKELGGLFGLSLKERGPTDSVAAHPFIKLLLEVRSDLRQAKQFTLADSIRNKLAAMGVSLEDGPDGTTWRFRQGDGP